MCAYIRTLLYNRADIGYLLLSWPLCRIFAVAAIISIQTITTTFSACHIPSALYCAVMFPAMRLPGQRQQPEENYKNKSSFHHHRKRKLLESE